jgi:cation diffusion facilitator CzcD-associated flavoprotein CzcO
VRETAEAFGIDRKIRYRTRLRRADWSSERGLWTVEAERGAERELVALTCGFLFMCTGYYDYDRGYTPEWPGIERFAGQIVHPQQWPDILDYAGKRVAIIGSGATAVTLAPALAEDAAHVTMVQRSPTYIVARPSQDRIANALHRVLPARVAHRLVRDKNIAFGMFFYSLARRRPARVKQAILKMAREQLPPGYDVERDFAPSYNPWDQRLCLAPDGDFFTAIRQGKLSIVTDTIETFTETGLRMRSGAEVPADLIITATGLNMRLMSGVTLSVDGVPVDAGATLSYRGTMTSGVPNLAASFGYTNASWTLKCEQIARYVCRVLNYMDRHGYVECLPLRPEGVMREVPAVTLTSGYVLRALATLPRQGSRSPWRTYQNYVKDLFNFRLSRLQDGAMRYSRRGMPTPSQTARSAAVHAGDGR